MNHSKSRILKFAATIVAGIIAADSLQAQETGGAKVTTETGETTCADTTHPWYGARVGIIGDSISDPKVANGPEKYYWFMQREIGIIPCVVAQNGQQWNEVLPQADRLRKEYGDDIDAILILMGTNDFNAGVPVGEWFIEEEVKVEAANGEPAAMQTRRHRSPDFNPDTFKGRINIALDSLKNMYPQKQIILLTPLHRGYAKFGRNNIQPDENHTNSCGEYLDAYINAVKEAGNVWAVPVIDLNAVSGIFPLNRSQKEYFPKDTDRLHPTDEGHHRMAEALIASLRALAPAFDR